MKKNIIRIIYVLIILLICVSFTIMSSICNAALKSDISNLSKNAKKDISTSEHYLKHSTKEYTIKLPYDYEKASNNSFFKINEEYFNWLFISPEKYDLDEYDFIDRASFKIMGSEIYNDDVLSEFKTVIETELLTNIQPIFAKFVLKILPDIDQTTLKTFIDNITYSLNAGDICNFSGNNYKAFHFDGVIHVVELDMYFNIYFVVTSNYVTTIFTASNNNNYFETDEMYSILNNFTINDEVLPEGPPLYINIIAYALDFLLTIFMYCTIPTLMRLIHGTYDKNKAHTISLINSAIVGIIFILIKNAMGIAITSTASFTYYYINKAILTRLNYKNIDKRKNKHKIRFIKSCNLSVESKQILLNKIEELSLADMREIEYDSNNGISDINLNRSEINTEYEKFIQCKVCGKEIPYNEYGTCEECHQKILNRLENQNNNIVDKRFCTKCGEEIDQESDDIKDINKELNIKNDKP